MPELHPAVETAIALVVAVIGLFVFTIPFLALSKFVNWRKSRSHNTHGHGHP